MSISTQGTIFGGASGGGGMIGFDTMWIVPSIVYM